MKNQDTDFIHPEDKNNLHYWTKKLGVTIFQLNDAILYTGTLDTDKIKTYLRKDSWFYHPSKGLKTIAKNLANLIF
jgi:hypothetical protein